MVFNQVIKDKDDLDPYELLAHAIWMQAADDFILGYNALRDEYGLEFLNESFLRKIKVKKIQLTYTQIMFYETLNFFNSMWAEDLVNGKINIECFIERLFKKADSKYIPSLKAMMNENKRTKYAPF